MSSKNFVVDRTNPAGDDALTPPPQLRVTQEEEETLHVQVASPREPATPSTPRTAAKNKAAMARVQSYHWAAPTTHGRPKPPSLKERFHSFAKHTTAHGLARQVDQRYHPFRRLFET